MDVWLIVLRYLRTRRAAWVACACIAVAVTAMVVVTAVMDGFRERIHRHIRGTEPDFGIRLKRGAPPDHESRVLAQLRGEIGHPGSEILAVSPRLVSVGLVLSGQGARGPGRATFTTHGVEIIGIDFDAEIRVIPLDRLVMENPDPALRPRDPWTTDPLKGAIPGIIIGRALANVLDVRRAEGAGFGPADHVNLLTGRVEDDGRGGTAFEPSNLIFRVVGCFESGRDDFDLTRVFISREAFRLLRYGDDPSRPDATSLHAKAKAGTDEALADLATRLERSHPDLVVETWIERNRSLVDALRIEKATMTVILAFIVMLSTALVLGLLAAMVMEKSRDIGVIRSLGMARRRLILTFATYGFLLGAIGSGIGVGAGVLIVARLNPIVEALGRMGIRVFSLDVAYKSREIPAILDGGQVAGIGIFAWVLAAGAALVVAAAAARVDPIAALQKE